MLSPSAIGFARARLALPEVVLEPAAWRELERRRAAEASRFGRPATLPGMTPAPAESTRGPLLAVDPPVAGAPNPGPRSLLVLGAVVAALVLLRS